MLHRNKMVIDRRTGNPAGQPSGRSSIIAAMPFPVSPSDRGRDR